MKTVTITFSEDMEAAPKDMELVLLDDGKQIQAGWYDSVFGWGSWNMLTVFQL